MSWTDEEIDDLFRDGASNQSFEYDNSYFGEFEAAALPVNGRGKDFLWLGTALVFVAVLTTGYLVNNANNTSFDTTEQLANLDLNTEDANTEMNSTDLSAETSAQDQIVSKNDTELTDLNNELSNNESSVVNTQPYTSNSANANQSSSANDAATQNGQNGPLTSMYDLATRNVSNKNKNNIDKSNTTLAASNGGQNATQQSANDNLSQLRNDAEAGVEKQLVRETSPITASLVLNGANQLDQGLNKNVAPHSIPPLGELRPKATLYFELNAGISQSLITPSDNTSKSFGGGLGVETHLGNFNLTTGLNVKASYHDDLFLSRKGKVYGFGSQEGVNTYDIRRIYSIEMPIMLGYNVGRHNFNFGVRPSLVVGSQTMHRAFENETLLRAEEMNGLIEANVDGEFYPALMRFGLKPVVGYAYRFNQWTVGANVGVQLMQSVNEEVMDGFNNQLPIDGQIYLRRTIRLRR